MGQMPDVSPSPESHTPGQRERTRKRLAYLVLGLCAAGIIVFSSLAIWLDSNARAETTRLVFVSVLPLFGTWVGMVLAYYYGSKNLKAATESTESLSHVTARLAGVVTPSTPVRERIIPRGDMKCFPTDDLDQVDLERLWQEFEKIEPLSRLPIVDSTERALGVVHRSLLDRFAVRQAGTIPEGLKGKTIADLSDEERRLVTVPCLTSSRTSRSQAFSDEERRLATLVGDHRLERPDGGRGAQRHEGRRERLQRRLRDRERLAERSGQRMAHE